MSRRVGRGPYSHGYRVDGAARDGAVLVGVASGAAQREGLHVGAGHAALRPRAPAAQLGVEAVVAGGVVLARPVGAVALHPVVGAAAAARRERAALHAGGGLGAPAAARLGGALAAARVLARPLEQVARGDGGERRLARELLAREAEHAVLAWVRARVRARVRVRVGVRVGVRVRVRVRVWVRVCVRVRVRIRAKMTARGAPPAP